MSTRREWLSFELELFREDVGEWLLLTGDRLLVCGLQVFLLILVVGVAMATELVPLRNPTPVLFLLFALIAANFTLIAIVTSLSQFALSRRLESAGDVREQMHDAVDYRVDVSETIQRSVMPVKLDAFFLALFESVEAQAAVIGEQTANARTRRTREELTMLTTGLCDHARFVVDLLERDSSGMKHALFTALNTQYETHVHRAWYLETEYADELAGDLDQQVRRLIETLEHVVVATRMFKTAFIESEVAELSRYLLFVGLPVQIIAVFVMLLYSTPDGVPAVSLTTIRLLVSGVLVGGFAPFLLLSSYVVRLTVVARRTVENFPFSTQLDERLELEDY